MGGLGCFKCLAACTGSANLKTFVKIWDVKIEYDTSNVKEYMNIDYIPMEKTLLDTADQYHTNGWLDKNHKW